MLQNFTMNCRSNWSNRYFTTVLASHNRSLCYLEDIYKLLVINEHTEICILPFCIFQYLCTSVWNHTKRSDNLKHLSARWVRLLQQYTGGNSLVLWLTGLEKKMFLPKILSGHKNQKVVSFSCSLAFLAKSKKLQNISKISFALEIN